MTVPGTSYTSETASYFVVISVVVFRAHSCCSKNIIFVIKTNASAAVSSGKKFAPKTLITTNVSGIIITK